MTRAVTQLASPLYDFEHSFWHNVIVSQRELTYGEVTSIKKITDHIGYLKKTYGVTNETDFLGRRVIAPVRIEPGPAYGSRNLLRAMELGWPILSQKTVRMRFYPGKHEDKRYPNVAPCEGSLEEGFVVSDSFTGTATNAFAMGSWSAYGGEDERDVGWVNDLKPFARNLPEGKMLIISVVYNADAKSNEEIIKQYAEAAFTAKKAGAHAAEANLSCPNTVGKADDLYKDANFSAKILGAMRDRVGPDFPLGLKVGYDKGYGPLVEETARFVDYYTGINAIGGEVKYPDGSLALPQTPKSGIGGAAIKHFGLEAAKKLVHAAKKHDKKTISAGGITIADDALEYFNVAGSDVVGVASAAIFRPIIPLEIQEALLMDKISKR